jgi:thiamine kinase-like enzyme
VDAQQIAEGLWPGRVQSVEPLGGGITNRNFRVDVDGEGTVVLRIGGKDTALLGIDRHVEHEASLCAAMLGLGPEVVAFVQPEGYLVTRYVDGEAPSVDEICRTHLEEIAAALRRFHEGPAIPGRFDSFRVVEAYAATATMRGVVPPAAFAEAKAIADRIERVRGEQPLRSCHNDLLNANFVLASGRFWIVDWEYAGMGDRFFDLANFSVNHECDAESNERLLRAYFGEVRADDMRALVLMRFMSDFREAMWGVVQQAISELDFDFADYANEHFERLQRTAADPAFAAALDAP